MILRCSLWVRALGKVLSLSVPVTLGLSSLAAAGLPQSVADSQLASDSAEFIREVADPATLTALSHTNVDRIEHELREGHSGFDAYLEAARAEVESFARKLDAEHATSPESAVAILRSGSVLSKKELGRENIVSTSTKAGDDTDSLTGEDDAIFFALTSDGVERFSDDDFGTVAFKLDKDWLLESGGYFTPYAYGKGSPISDAGDAANGPPAERLDRNLMLYRAFVMVGTEDFRKFLRLSIAQVLWENDHLPKGFGERSRQWIRSELNRQKWCDALDPRSKPGFRCSPDDPRIPQWSKTYNDCMNPTYARSSWSGIYGALGQAYPSGLPEREDSHSVERIYEYFTRSVANPIERMERVLNAFRAMPLALNGLSFLESTHYNWWELKVRRQVLLEHLDRIVVDDMRPDRVKMVRDAAAAFASAHGKRVVEMAGTPVNGVTPYTFAFRSR